MGKLRTYNRRRLRKARSCDWRGWIKHGEPYGAVWHRARLKHGGGPVRKDWDDPFALEKKLELAEGYGSGKLAKKLRRRLAYLAKKAMEQDPLCRQTWTIYPSFLKRIQSVRGTHFIVLDTNA